MFRFNCSKLARSKSSFNRLTVFGLSAIDNSSSAVRRMGEKIVVKLYEIDPITVRRIMPPYNPSQVMGHGNQA